MTNHSSNGQQLLATLRQQVITVTPQMADHVESDHVHVITNYQLISQNGKEHRQGLLVQDIRHDVYELTGGWPKRVGDTLFVEGPNHQPIYLATPTKLFAWLDELALVDWQRGSDCITQERLFANLQMHAEAYAAVETVPHFPAQLNAYYMHRELPASDGGHLEHFVDFFAPMTSTDRELVKAFLMTLCWGGPLGKRPAFLITGPDQDPDPDKKGRGVGKSTLVSLASKLVGGLMTFSARENIADIKKRLLSPEAVTLRVALLDNLKTLRFSWADLEGLITADVISGHRMYQGEGRRPNNVVWAMTLNGATLSKDMAERCVIIKLGRPANDPCWQQRVENYLEEHRWEILADIQHCLCT